ncbi:unnamed protein product, partial [Rotaria sordida]
VFRLFQLGFHELSTDDILATTNHNSQPILAATSESILSRQQRVIRTASYSSESISTPTPRPIGIAEPVPRLPSGLISRAYKSPESDTDKSVQVNTIIRSCGRCAGSSPSPSRSLLSVRRHSVISPTPLSPGENSSGGEDEDTSP